MLSTRVKSAADLMSIALQAEREAIRRYSQLAVEMRAGGNQSAAALFERMAAEEQAHERLLLEWMARESIAENPDIGPIRWRDPEAPGRYDDEARSSGHSTPYKALAFAVTNEEIAFRFYTQVVADTDDDRVRQYAETLAREELGHAALLRAERRRAYHAERDAGPPVPRLNPGAIRTQAELLATAIQIDRCLVEATRDIAADSPPLRGLSRRTLQQIVDNEIALKKITPNSADAISAALRIDLGAIEIGGIGDTRHDLESKLELLRNYCDLTFVFYDAIVESTTDEAILLTAQRLASAALDRIAELKQAG